MKKHFAIRATSLAVLTALTITSSSRSAAQQAPASTAVPSLDFEFFKTRVEPIFLKKRPGHARCYLCHAAESGANAQNTAFHLEKRSPRNTSWTEEQSRRNFEVVSRIVTPGEPLSSLLLMHPLARDAGGDVSHGGGRQFASQKDPDWLTLAEWVRGQKAAGSPSDK